MEAFENRQPVTAAKFITKSSLFIRLPAVIRRLERTRMANKKLRIYSSSRHIANAMLAGAILFFYLPETKQSFKNYSINDSR